MASDILTHRNRLLAALVIFAVLVTLIAYWMIRSVSPKDGGPQIYNRSPIERLAYCGADLTKLCIISFSQIVDGGMQINMQTPYAYYPEFVLKIDRYGEESTYTCRRAAADSTAVVCKGAPQVPGEALEFQVISKYWGTVLAEGKFAIIGIALYTPEVEFTATIEQPTETPTETPTMIPTLQATPVVTRPVLTVPPNSTSYPNPYP